MMSYWRTLSSEPVKLLDSIIEHSKISSEFASLLDSVAQKFEALEDELTAVTEERDNAIASLDQSEDEIIQLEDQVGELSDRVVELEDKLENLEDGVGRMQTVIDNQQTVGDIKPPMSIDLAKYVGKNCYVEMSNGDKGNCYVNYLQTKDAVLLLDFDKLFNRHGRHGDGSLHVTLIRELEGSFRDCVKADNVIKPVDNFKKVDLANYFGSHVAITMMDGTEHIGEVGKNHHDRYSIIDCFIPSHHYLEDIVKIEYTDGNPAGSQWITDIDLTQWIGKIVDVKLRNGTIVDAVNVNPRAGKALYQVKVEHVSYTRCGKHWHDRLDGRDIMAIRPTT